MKETLINVLKLFCEKDFNLEKVKILSTGKEAIVYLVKDTNSYYALKVYKDYAIRSFKRNESYLEGKQLHRPSQRKAVRKKSRYGKKLLHRLWIKREFYLMKKLYSKGANIPKPIEMVKGAILIEFIGENEEKAPLLKNVSLDKNEAERIYKSIIKNLEIFERIGIVHGDLSPYNILYQKGDIFIIDFPQSADVRNNSNSFKLRKRDRNNIEKWFGKYG